MENYTYREYSGTRSRIRAEQKARAKRRVLAAVKRISGIVAFVSFMMVIGKAGASDCGAAWEEIFPSTFYYTAAFVLSMSVFNYLDQNK